MKILYILFGMVIMWFMCGHQLVLHDYSSTPTYIQSQIPTHPILPAPAVDPRREEFMRDCLQYVQNRDQCTQIWP
jgi:hypothetical protein